MLQSQSQLPKVSTRLALVWLEYRLGSGYFFFLKMKVRVPHQKPKFSDRRQKLDIIYIIITIVITYNRRFCEVGSLVFNLLIGESNRIRTVPECGHSRYLRNHKSYKKC